MASSREEPNKNEPRSGIQVITRAANILRALENETNGLSLSEIAIRVGLPRSTVQRIVAALADEQFLIAATPKSRVKLGSALIRLANAANLEVSDLVRPFMDALSRELGETIDLSILHKKSAVFVNQVPGTHRLRAVSAVGERFPLHSTANGKSLLALLPEDKLEKQLSGSLETFTANTITSPSVLKKEFKKIRETLIAYDREEYTEGICAVSTSFEDPFGRAFALSVPTPVKRFERNMEKIEEALLQCQSEILAMLGDTAEA